MTRRFLPQPRSGRSSCTSRTSKRSTTDAKPVNTKASLPSVRFRKGQPRLPANPNAKTSLPARILTIKRKSLTLQQWSRRTQAGPPKKLWNRIKAGWPVEEALGGSAAVARAIAFVSVKEARAIRGAERRAEKQRRVAVRRPARRASRRSAPLTPC
jgi:hypothetical protein